MPLEIPGCTLFNSECTISAGNTLRIGPEKNYTITCLHYVSISVSVCLLQSDMNEKSAMRVRDVLIEHWLIVST